jgi:ferredoxin/flavodoxin
MKIAIFYFSGTGNTAVVSREFAAAFGPANPVELIDIAASAPPAPDFLGGLDLVGFGAPVHCFNPPLAFARFVSRLPRVSGNRAFVFLTAGGDGFGAAAWVAGRLTRQGFDVLGFSTLVLPLNISVETISQHDVTVSFLGWRYSYPLPGVFENCRDRIRATADRLLRGARYGTPPRRWQAAVTDMCRPVFYLGNAMMRFHFHVSRSCDRCGRCADACPQTNIQVSARRVRFGGACTACCRCINVCPRRAVQVRWPGNVMMNRVPYLAPGWQPTRVARHPRA